MSRPLPSLPHPFLFPLPSSSLASQLVADASLHLLSTHIVVASACFGVLLTSALTSSVSPRPLSLHLSASLAFSEDREVVIARLFKIPDSNNVLFLLRLRGRGERERHREREREREREKREEGIRQTRKETLTDAAGQRLSQASQSRQRRPLLVQM